MATFNRGDRVIPINDPCVPAASRGRIYRVRKVNPTNLRCDAEDGGRGINFPAVMLLAATDENVAAQRQPVVGRPYEPPELYSLGELVTLKRPHKDWTVETPLVVVGGRGEKVNVTVLGGANDRYLRVVSSGLVRRDREWLREALA